MIYLNLLPDKFRQELKYRYFYRLSLRLGVILVVFMACISGIFVASNAVLNNFYNVIDSTNFIMGTKIKEPIKVNDVNRKINEVSKIYNNSVNWPEVVASTTAPFKDEVCLSEIDINKSKGLVEIKGSAQSRDSLISLKEALEASEFFYDLRFPIKDYFQKEDINFSLKAKIKL